MTGITSHDLTLYRFMQDTLGHPAMRPERLGPFWSCIFCGARLALTCDCWEQTFSCLRCSAAGDLLDFVARRRHCNRDQAAALIGVGLSPKKRKRRQEEDDDAA